MDSRLPQKRPFESSCAQRPSVRRLGLSLLTTILVLLQASLTWADPVVEPGPEDTTTASAVEDKSRALWTFPFLITFGLHGGYDSNPNTTRNGSGSAFTDQQLTLAYDRLRGPLDLKTLAALGVVERFDGQTDVNTSLDLALNYQASPRLTLGTTVNAVYTSEPSFAANVGPTQRAGNYFVDGRRAFGCLSVVAPGSQLSAAIPLGLSDIRTARQQLFQIGKRTHSVKNSGLTYGETRPWLPITAFFWSTMSPILWTLRRISLWPGWSICLIGGCMVSFAVE